MIGTSQPMRQNASPVGMRQAFGETLVEIGRANPRVIMIDCETATSTFAVLFGKAFPSRFIQMGVAEQNALSFAAGLSTAGFVPFVPLFGCFSSRRAADQVFCQVAYPNFNVKIMGCFAGMSSPNTGATHQALQDLAIMRSIPHMLVLEPADEAELRQALCAVFEYVGPVYFRMVRGDIGGTSPTVSSPGYRFRLGKAAVLREGSDVTLVGSGLMVSRCFEAAGVLAAKGVEAEVINFSTVKPLDVDSLISSATKTGAVVVAENHSVIGGLGGAVAEALIERFPVPMRRVGVNDRFGESGPLKDLFEKYRLTAGAVVEAAEEVLRLRRK